MVRLHTWYIHAFCVLVITCRCNLIIVLANLQFRLSGYSYIFYKIDKKMKIVRDLMTYACMLYNYNVTVHNTTNYSSGGQARDLVAQLQLGSMVESVAQGYLHEQEYLHEAIIIRDVFLL